MALLVGASPILVGEMSWSDLTLVGANRAMSGAIPRLVGANRETSGAVAKLVGAIATPGFRSLSLAQLKILQEVIPLGVFLPFALFFMRQPLTWNSLWAGLCLLGAAYFMFR